MDSVSRTITAERSDAVLFDLDGVLTADPVDRKGVSESLKNNDLKEPVS